MQIGPMLPHIDDILTAKFPFIEFAGFGGESIRFDASCCGENMSMMIALVAVSVRRMNRYISDDTEAHDKVIREGECECFSIFGIQFCWDRNLPFSRRDSVLSLLGGLGMVPQRGAILRPFRRRFWRYDPIPNLPIGVKLWDRRQLDERFSELSGFRFTLATEPNDWDGDA